MAIDYGPLRSTTARELISALVRDGFGFDRGSGSHQIYRHNDGRRVTVTFHGSGDTFAPKTLKSMIESDANMVLIDVREPNEFEILRIPGSILIPKQEILNGTALASLPQTKQIVLYCKSGARSAECLAVIKSAGFADAVHVGGGVLAWAREIDPSLPVY